MAFGAPVQRRHTSRRGINILALFVHQLEHVSDAANYIQNWLAVLKQDRRALFVAARLASAAADYLCPPEPAPAAGHPEPEGPSLMTH